MREFVIFQLTASWKKERTHHRLSQRQYKSKADRHDWDFCNLFLYKLKRGNNMIPYILDRKEVRIISVPPDPNIAIYRS